MPSIHGRVGFAAYKSICKNVITVTASRRQSLILFNYHKCYPIAENSSVLRPHSIIIASCKPGCKPGFLPGSQPGFRQIRAGLRHAFDMLSTRFQHAFDFFFSKTWSRTCCINLDMSRLMQQVCWFVRVLDKWNVEKTRFEPVNEPIEAGFSLRILLFVLIVT